MPSVLTQDQMNSYLNDGYVIVKALFDSEEIDLLRRRSGNPQPLIRPAGYQRHHE